MSIGERYAEKGRSWGMESVWPGCGWGLASRWFLSSRLRSTATMTSGRGSRPSRCRSEAWVIEDEGAVVALMVLEPGWMDQFYVDPMYTGSGLGSRLVDLAKELNPDGVDLWTFQANAGARRFYERHGFVAVATTEGDNEEGAPDVRYHWPNA